LYYKDDYFYACYNGYSYYLADGTWYFDFWKWSCQYDSPPKSGYYGQYVMYWYNYYFYDA